MPEPDRALAEKIVDEVVRWVLPHAPAAHARVLAADAVAALLPAAPAPPQGAEDLARDIERDAARVSALGQHGAAMLMQDSAARVRQLAAPVASGCETCAGLEKIMEGCEHIDLGILNRENPERRVGLLPNNEGRGERSTLHAAPTLAAAVKAALAASAAPRTENGSRG